MPKETFALELEKEINNALDDNFKIFMHQEFYKLMFPYIPFRTGCLSSTLSETNYPIKEPVIADDEYAISLALNIYAISLALNSGNIDETGIEFTANHAEDCYYGGRTFNPTYHPLATANWGEIAFNANKEELENILTDYLERKS